MTLLVNIIKDIILQFDVNVSAYIYKCNKILYEVIFCSLWMFVL